MRLSNHTGLTLIVFFKSVHLMGIAVHFILCEYNLYSLFFFWIAKLLESNATLSKPVACSVQMVLCWPELLVFSVFCYTSSIKAEKSWFILFWTCWTFSRVCGYVGSNAAWLTRLLLFFPPSFHHILF